MDKNLYKILYKRSCKYMETDRLYHDVSHINNVVKNANLLISKVGGDDVIIITSLLFHDIRRDVDDHEKIGAEETREILQSIPLFPQNMIKEVCIAIERHEKGQITQNEKIISDADKIDAFSITGLGRGFMMLSKKGYTLKKGIKTYSNLLQRWYHEFHFEESRKIVNNDYKKIKKLLQEMIDTY